MESKEFKLETYESGTPEFEQSILFIKNIKLEKEINLLLIIAKDDRIAFEEISALCESLKAENLVLRGIPDSLEIELNLYKAMLRDRNNYLDKIPNWIKKIFK